MFPAQTNQVEDTPRAFNPLPREVVVAIWTVLDVKYFRFHTFTYTGSVTVFQWNF